MPEARMRGEGGSTSAANAAQPRVVAMMNQKGGVGKTTTTVNLAAAIAELGRRTLIIDLDPQAHATLHLGVDPAALESSVYDLLIDESVDPRAVAREVRPALALVPAEVNLAAAETELAPSSDRQRRLARIIDALRAHYDFIFIDCPPSLGLLTLNALAAADEVLIPMQAHFLALQGVGKLLETVRLVAQTLNPRLVASGVVLCMHDDNTNHAKEVVADLERFFAQASGQDVPWRTARVHRPAIRRNIKLAECPSFGQTIFEYAAWCPGAIDYRKLAQGFVEAHAAGVDVDAPPPAVHVVGAPSGVARAADADLP